MESLKSMTSALLVIVPFVLIFSLVFKEIRKQKRKWAVINELNRRLEELKQEILVVSTPTIPDKKIEQKLGKISAESAISGSQYKLAETRALIFLMLTAKGKGANAIVGFHRERSPYEVAKKIPLHARTIRLVGKAVRIAELAGGNS
jgi:uncharacterized protein YbjQ (UPF0145 family)